LWSVSRHPNYLGEIGFWWGLYLFALAADPSRWWTVFGPVAVTALFLAVSLPMIEARMRQRRSDYGAVCDEVAMLIPSFFPRR
jgi:steroid 5-alpha reductase family enzyme